MKRIRILDRIRIEGSKENVFQAFFDDTVCHVQNRWEISKLTFALPQSFFDVNIEDCVRDLYYSTDKYEWKLNYRVMLSGICLIQLITLYMVFNGTYLENLNIYYNIPNMERREFPSLTIIMFEMIFQIFMDEQLSSGSLGFKLKWKKTVEVMLSKRSGLIHYQ